MIIQEHKRIITKSLVKEKIMDKNLSLKEKYIMNFKHMVKEIFQKDHHHTMRVYFSKVCDFLTHFSSSVLET